VLDELGATRPGAGVVTGQRRRHLLDHPNALAPTPTCHTRRSGDAQAGRLYQPAAMHHRMDRGLVGREWAAPADTSRLGASCRRAPPRPAERFRHQAAASIVRKAVEAITAACWTHGMLRDLLVRAIDERAAWTAGDLDRRAWSTPRHGRPRAGSRAGHRPPTPGAGLLAGDLWWHCPCSLTVRLRVAPTCYHATVRVNGRRMVASASPSSRPASAGRRVAVRSSWRRVERGGSKRPAGPSMLAGLVSRFSHPSILANRSASRR
jgi:hypothetical protein